MFFRCPKRKKSNNKYLFLVGKPIEGFCSLYQINKTLYNYKLYIR